MILSGGNFGGAVYENGEVTYEGVYEGSLAVDEIDGVISIPDGFGSVWNYRVLDGVFVGMG